MPVIDLKNWVVQHKAQVCTITAKIDVPNPVINEANFKSLVALLVEKRVVSFYSSFLSHNLSNESTLFSSVCYRFLEFTWEGRCEG